MKHQTTHVNVGTKQASSRHQAKQASVTANYGQEKTANQRFCFIMLTCREINHCRATPGFQCFAHLPKK